MVKSNFCQPGETQCSGSVLVHFLMPYVAWYKSCCKHLIAYTVNYFTAAYCMWKRTDHRQNNCLNHVSALVYRIYWKPKRCFFSKTITSIYSFCSCMYILATVLSLIFVLIRTKLISLVMKFIYALFSILKVDNGK